MTWRVEGVELFPQGRAGLRRCVSVYRWAGGWARTGRGFHIRVTVAVCVSLVCVGVGGWVGGWELEWVSVAGDSDAPPPRRRWACGRGGAIRVLWELSVPHYLCSFRLSVHSCRSARVCARGIRWKRI